MINLLTRDEIISLIKEIERLLESNLDGKEFDRELEKLNNALEVGVLDPGIRSYVYYEKPELTPEEIADRALAYKPIILPDESQR
ncbi:MAG: hypothetical protein OXF89_13460 [Rhodospirillaceae bacterium]|nr:hypothetical protein [Rhodospirillaceae bacterium]MCY4064863.1 hypothetical protein [Rhodospirillaceae bacterium]MDE0705103.1 hypothetical protein [Rhodospirillaceae bacterium]